MVPAHGAQPPPFPFWARALSESHRRRSGMVPAPRRLAGSSRAARSMAGQPSTTRTAKPEATWELVLKRNPVERLKQEKTPLGMLAELPALIAAGYENVPEEDLVRLKWWGLYHDKPKVGTFM